MLANNIDLELNLAHNYFGRLNLDIRRRIKAVVSHPSQETWDDAHCIIVGSDGWMTLWQAVLIINPSFTRVGKTTDVHGNIINWWSEIPDRPTLVMALQYATH